MADTLSNMMPLGTQAPDFTLIDTVSNKTLSLNELKGDQATVIFFICNHCPFVIHVNKQLVTLASDYKAKGVNCIAISSNDVENYPQDAPDKMKITAKKEGYIFPYLYDETQAVAHAYNAACTPDFYVFDANHSLKYRGQLDDSRPGNAIPVTGQDIRHALDCIISKTDNLKPQKPSIGCGIKWIKA
ncbi:alkyl hydroperoxide reductase [Formosa agariphila KMM 3901]|uniref:Alkyl hydroperoxide reductase n=1 Tax=Formosa agariphila (strain DSM 15362 / KCTC 12365 / LMG 23005 / KMM 3901 / M-2Alg 35-1) TaxID=1347342 RepID=T2KIU1_FORAG|nr:thioredoxin family protein [Formosa agariphila]CDF78797.1 alkyl hydroperoxide reductase [Formosa agariphila KMM 3901]